MQQSIHSREDLYKFIHRDRELLSRVKTYINLYKELVLLVETCIDLFIETQDSLSRKHLHINLYKELLFLLETCI